MTPLRLAAECDNDQIAELLISSGADLNRKDWVSSINYPHYRCVMLYAIFCHSYDQFVDYCKD